MNAVYALHIIELIYSPQIDTQYLPAILVLHIQRNLRSDRVGMANCITGLEMLQKQFVERIDADFQRDEATAPDSEDVDTLE